MEFGTAAGGVLPGNGGAGPGFMMSFGGTGGGPGMQAFLAPPLAGFAPAYGMLFGLAPAYANAFSVIAMFCFTIPSVMARPPLF